MYMLRAFGSHIAHQMRVAAARRCLPASVFGPVHIPPVGQRPSLIAPATHDRPLRVNEARKWVARLLEAIAGNPGGAGHGAPCQCGFGGGKAARRSISAPSVLPARCRTRTWHLKADEDGARPDHHVCRRLGDAFFRRPKGP